MQNQAKNRITIKYYRIISYHNQILVFIENNAGAKSGDVARKLDIPNPTVKRILTNLANQNLIEKFGIGAGTNYGIK